MEEPGMLAARCMKGPRAKQAKHSHTNPVRDLENVLQFGANDGEFDHGVGIDAELRARDEDALHPPCRR